MLPALVLCVVMLIFVGRMSHLHISAIRINHCDWNDLFKKLEAVPQLAVAQVGDEYLNPRPNQIAIEPVDIWVGLGGMDGIRRMRRNARVLIALAGYAERWNFTESVIVKERMRRDALHLQIAALQISARLFLGIGRIRFAFYLQESAASYHLMTKRLLALYQTSNSALYLQLASALGEGSA